MCGAGMETISLILLTFSSTLIMVDGIITWRGVGLGLREVNQVLRYLLRRFGVWGLVMTRLVSLALLIALFKVLEGWEWILFSSTFSIVMSYVILNGFKKTHAAMAETVP
jgi:hypothetical protein